MTEEYDDEYGEFEEMDVEEKLVYLYDRLDELEKKFKNLEWKLGQD